MNKNKKGEMSGLGLVIIVAVTLIVGLVLFQVIAQEVGDSTNTVTLANQSLTSTVVNGTPQYITNCRALASVVVFNETNNVELGSGNYTFTDNSLDSTGSLSVKVDPTATAGFKSKWKVSGTCQPTTYIAEAGSRSVAGLIVVMFALAVLVVALSPTLRNDFMDLVRS